MERQSNEIERCTVCLQPTIGEYRFDLIYNENGEKTSKSFCGASCLRQWVEKDLDKIHLHELESLE